ncbi:MAG: hypothetical protein AABN33_18380 [Acidobacteriota bacterium]
MTGRMSTITISGVVSPAAVFDFYEIVCAVAKPIRIRRIRIAQTSEPPTTDEEQLALTVIRGHTTSGSGGDTTPDGGVLCSTTPAPGYTAETMNTSIASAGTPVNLVEDAWNTRAGYDMAFAPEEAPEAVNGERLVLRSAAPADAVTIRATMWVEELG